MPFFDNSLLTYHEDIPIHKMNDLYSNFIFTDKELPKDIRPEDVFWSKEKKEWLRIKLNPSNNSSSDNIPIGILNPNRKIVLNKMPEYIIIDDFFKNVDEVLLEAKNLNKNFTREFYSVIGEFNPEDWIEDFFSSTIGKEIELVKGQCIIKMDLKNHSLGNKRSHHDWPLADYIALVYFSEGNNSGTEFVKIEGEKKGSLFVDDTDPRTDVGRNIEPYFCAHEKKNRVLIYNSFLYHREKNLYDNRIIKRYFMKIKT